MDIVTIGEVLIDLTQTGKDARGIPQFAANPGGAPANLAVAAARLGAQTAFIGKVGADAFGRYLKEVLAENKVDVSGMAVDADHMPCFLHFSSKANEASVSCSVAFTTYSTPDKSHCSTSSIVSVSFSRREIRNLSSCRRRFWKS